MSINKLSQTPSEKVTTKLFDSKSSKTVNEPVTQKLRQSPTVETQSHADRAIQRWNEKLLKQSQSKLVILKLIFSLNVFKKLILKS